MSTPSGCNTARLAFSCWSFFASHSPRSSCANEPGNVCHGSNGKRGCSSRSPVRPTENGGTGSARTRNDQSRRCRFLLWHSPSAVRYQSGNSTAGRNGVYRSIRLWQDHSSSLFQPDERPNRRRSYQLGPNRARWPRHARTGHRRGGFETASGNGFPEIEPVSEVDLRKCRLRSARSRGEKEIAYQ